MVLDAGNAEQIRNVFVVKNLGSFQVGGSGAYFVRLSTGVQNGEPCLLNPKLSPSAKIQFVGFVKSAASHSGPMTRLGGSLTRIHGMILQGALVYPSI